MLYRPLSFNFNAFHRLFLLKFLYVRKSLLDVLSPFFLINSICITFSNVCNSDRGNACVKYTFTHVNYVCVVSADVTKCFCSKSNSRYNEIHRERLYIGASMPSSSVCSSWFAIPLCVTWCMYMRKRRESVISLVYGNRQLNGRLVVVWVRKSCEMSSPLYSKQPVYLYLLAVLPCVQMQRRLGSSISQRFGGCTVLPLCHAHTIREVGFLVGCI